MIELSLSSNNKLTDLSNFIREVIPDESFKLTQKDKNLTVSLNSECNIDVFYTQLSIFIFSILESRLMSKLVDLFGENSEQEIDIESIIEEDFFSIYVNPIKILINEHFKYSTHMSIESFINFNCKGLKKELNSKYNDYRSLLNQENCNQYSQELNADTLSNELESSLANYNNIKKINSVFLKIKPAISLRINNDLYDEFNTVHLRTRLNKLELVSNKNTDLVEIINELITQDIFEELETFDDNIKIFIHILFSIIVLESKQIIFHKSTRDDITSQILLYLYETSYLNDQINKATFLKCKGCDIC